MKPSFACLRSRRLILLMLMVATTPLLTFAAEATRPNIIFILADDPGICKPDKLTRDYFITHQSDSVSAAERFDKYDTDKDGFLSREEFIGRGRTSGVK